MDKINFQDGVTKGNAETFNTMQNNIEAAINEVKEVNTYSTTNEKKVGTWIDGKPLYKKTFVWEKTGYTGGSAITDYIDILSLGVDTVFIDGSSSFIIDYVKNSVVMPTTAGVVNVSYEYKTYILDNKIYVSGYNSKRCITIKYTKTTD